MTGDERDSYQLHTHLRELLPLAQAESRQVAATFLDIRGFSSFTTGPEPFDAATYLRSIYTRILDSYFSDASFFKPTGDGLMLIHECPNAAEEMKALVTSIVERCLDLIALFPDLTEDDIRVNFDVPQSLGVGIARGVATRLVSGGVVLDYTGQCLNLAARLMDKARPQGLVFSDRRASDLLDPKIADLLTADQICVRGIADQEPIQVWTSVDVMISRADREPVPDSGITWGPHETMTIDEVKRQSSFAFNMPRLPRSYESPFVHIACPTFDDNGLPDGYETSLVVEGATEEHPDSVFIRIPMTRAKLLIADIPETFLTRFLKSTKTTQLTFTPYFDIVSEEGGTQQ